MASDRELARRELRRRLMDHGVRDERRQEQVSNIPIGGDVANSFRGRVNEFSRDPIGALGKGFMQTLGVDLDITEDEFFSALYRATDGKKGYQGTSMPSGEYSELQGLGRIDPNAPAIQEAMGWFPGPMGALGTIVNKTAKLPMDEASRMQRARDMGFDTDMYHGTDKDFSEFDISTAGSGEQQFAKENALKSVFLTDNPRVAEGYLDGALVDAQTHKTPFRRINSGIGRTYTEGGNLMPLKINTENMTMIDAGGSFWDDPLVKSEVNNAKSKGASGVLVKNLKDPGVMSYGGGEVPSTVAMIFDDSKIRSKFAKFDPSKKESANLLAGLGGLGLGLGYLGQQEEYD